MNPDTDTPRLLLVTGSTRKDSTNSAALRTAPELLRDGSALLYDRLAELPAFNPDDDHEPLPSEVTALRTAIAAADAVVFCTPEYAGTLPGSFKNLLDWTVGGAEMYGKPATWINVAGPGRGTGADETLAVVLGYVGAAVMRASGARAFVPRQALDPIGRITDETTRAALAEAFAAITNELRQMGAPTT